MVGMDPLTLRTVAIFLQSLLYGCNLISLYHAIRELVTHDGTLKARQDVNKQMLIIAIILAGFGTVNIGFALNAALSVDRAYYSYYVGRKSTVLAPAIDHYDYLAGYPLTALLVSLYSRIVFDLLNRHVL
jgi:hypothetical protein